jgi:hypothetical protein
MWYEKGHAETLDNQTAAKRALSKSKAIW